ncbi:secretory calcium-binding phosphoprotein 9 isoform X2 [Dicentrarchus labrax]|uniref:secretory calcium-binding phosphoprotein 9 isoform X2 n=1 Tax=Dicentrarchus labrax TaxID=13489 RepID=UPI0021F58FA8|nr:secretory calcium-binding phosphoprotein 9 isoform X2 [Dicentrarchus labrax]
MKLLLLTTFVATICYKQRMLAAMMAGMNGGLMPGMNGGLMGGMNGGLMGGMNGGLIPGMNGGLMGGLNGGMANGAIPGMMARGLNPPMVAGGGAGFLGQPQFAQFVPGLPAFALPAPIANVYPVPGVNAPPIVGVPQMLPMNLPQQPLMGNTGGAMQQQLQPDPLRRFRRQIMKQDNTLKTTVDTQIPAPAATMTTTRCDEGRRENN